MFVFNECGCVQQVPSTCIRVRVPAFASLPPEFCTRCTVALLQRALGRSRRSAGSRDDDDDDDDDKNFNAAIRNNQREI